MFNLSVNNFRSFQNQKLNFSRVNILIGENSGGKSSLLKLLLALKQTIDSPLDLNLKLVGDYTDLGNYEEVVYNKNKSKKISIGFESSSEYFDKFLEHINTEYAPSRKKLERIKKIISKFQESKTSAKFTFNSKLNDHRSINTIIKNNVIGELEIIQKSNEEESLSRNLICDVKIKFGNISDVITNCVCFKSGFLTIFDDDFRDKFKKQFKEDAEEIYYSFTYLLYFQNYIYREIDKIRFVNPIGKSPQRFYFQEDRKANFQLIDIEKFINILGDKTLSERSYKEQIGKLNKIIQTFGIANELKIIKDKQLPVIALNVRTKDFWSNITDVGYGVSLQLPILFQALLSENYTERGETILIEQPEVHLHPKLQSNFIDTLLSLGNKNTYFIETHSEHIVRKLQVIAKNKMYGISEKDITIHYFKRESLKFDITEHKILEDGRLNPAFPDGFYDNTYSLVKQLL